MTDANPHEEERPAGKYQVRSMIAAELPPEGTYPLSNDEFQTLCDGSKSDAKPALLFCIGLFVSALVGVLSLAENTDWDSFWAHKRGALMVYFAVLVFIAAGSLTVRASLGTSSGKKIHPTQGLGTGLAGTSRRSVRTLPNSRITPKRRVLNCPCFRLRLFS